MNFDPCRRSLVLAAVLQVWYSAGMENTFRLRLVYQSVYTDRQLSRGGALHPKSSNDSFYINSTDALGELIRGCIRPKCFILGFHRPNSFWVHRARATQLC